MTPDEIIYAVKQLQSSAAAFGDGIRRANRLPEGYPRAEMEEIIRQAGGIAGADANDLRAIVHLHDKLLESMGAYSSADESASANHLRRLHNELFIEAARFIATVDHGKVQAAKPKVEAGTLTVQSIDYRAMSQQLLTDAQTVIQRTENATIILNQYVTNKSFSVAHLGDIKLALNGIRKACIGLNIELNAKLVDLSWVSEFMKWLELSRQAIVATTIKLGERFSRSELGKILSATLEACAMLIKGVGGLVQSIIRSAKFERKYGLSAEANQHSNDTRTGSGRSLAELEAANAASRDFIANMSHELRTPLNAIIGFTDVVRDELFGPIGDERYKEYIDDVAKTSRHILSIVSDMLDISKIEMGRFALDEETFIVDEVVADSLAMMRLQIKKLGVNSHCTLQTAGVQIFADRRQIKQALLNLLSNAAKFTPEGGTVDITSEVLPDGSLVLTVSDTGIGMAKEELGWVTKIGGAPSSRKHPGAGLGLPLTALIVEEHGGVLEIESEKGLGTTVRVRLPSNRVHR